MTSTPHALAGHLAPDEMLLDVPALLTAYEQDHPDPGQPGQRVAFGTSGHRGSSLSHSFNQDHILAICQSLAEYRRGAGIDGPLYVAHDTHALSEPARATALEVLAANGVAVRIDSDERPIATPLLSHAVRAFNHGRSSGLADGLVITPSHNPPRDGGMKYNPPHGGPADGDAASAIETRANQILEQGLGAVKRMPLAAALASDGVQRFDFVTPYVDDLDSVLDMDAIAASGLRLGADPLGGTALPVWGPIAERWGLDITIVNQAVDPSFRFVPVDRDGRIRMDCSSPWAMSGLVAMAERFDLAFGNDTDADRHGIVTPDAGLLNPNHFLASAIHYLFSHRPGWGERPAVGKTLVSSSMIDRVAAALGRPLVEVPVGFKWFVSGLADGSLGLGGEESAGASFLRRDGSCWTTDKDGLLLCLLAAEITAVTGSDPGECYRRLTAEHGEPVYERIDTPCPPENKARLKQLSPDQVTARELAGEPILATLTRAPGNGEPIGGLKLVTENGWFAARPSGTEDVSKLYAESFLGADHLARIQQEAQAIVARALAT